MEIMQTYDKGITIQGLVAYYPLTGKYIAYNTLYKYGSVQNLDGKEEPQLRRWTYASAFDYTFYHLERGTFLNSGFSQDSCAEGCLRCFGKGICFECIEGYALKGVNCIKVEYYFATLPAKNANDINIDMVIPNDQIPQPEITITFWIKIYGNKGDANGYDIFYYSDSLKIM